MNGSWFYFLSKLLADCWWTNRLFWPDFRCLLLKNMVLSFKNDSRWKHRWCLLCCLLTPSSQKQAIQLSFYDCECWLWMFVIASNRSKQHICDARLWVGQARSGWCGGQERRCSAVDKKAGKKWRTERKRQEHINIYLHLSVFSVKDSLVIPLSHWLVIVFKWIKMSLVLLWMYILTWALQGM